MQQQRFTALLLHSRSNRPRPLRPIRATSEATLKRHASLELFILRSSQNGVKTTHAPPRFIPLWQISRPVQRSGHNVSILQDQRKSACIDGDICPSYAPLWAIAMNPTFVVRVSFHAPLLHEHRTLLDLKRTLLTALPMLRSDASTSSSPPDLVSSETHTTSSSSLDSVCGTSDIVMWRRRGVEGMDRFGVADGDAQGPEGWVCLEVRASPCSFPRFIAVGKGQ